MLRCGPRLLCAAETRQRFAARVLRYGSGFGAVALEASGPGAAAGVPDEMAFTSAALRSGSSVAAGAPVFVDVERHAVSKKWVAKAVTTVVGAEPSPPNAKMSETQQHAKPAAPGSRAGTTTPSPPRRQQHSAGRSAPRDLSHRTSDSRAVSKGRVGHVSSNGTVVVMARHASDRGRFGKGQVVVLPPTVNPVIIGCWVEYSGDRTRRLTKVGPPEVGPPPTAEGLMGVVVSADAAHGVVRDLYSHQRFRVASTALDELKRLLASSGYSAVAAGTGGPPLVFDTSWEKDARGESVIVAANLRAVPSAETWSADVRKGSPLQGNTQTSGYTYVSRKAEGRVVRFNGRHGHIRVNGGSDVFFVSGDVDCEGHATTQALRVGHAVTFDVVVDDMKPKVGGKAPPVKAVSVVQQQPQLAAADGSKLLGTAAASEISAAADAMGDLSADEGAVTLCSGVSGVVSHHLGGRRFSAVAVRDHEAPKDVRKWFVLAEGAMPIGSIVTLDVVEVVPSSGARPVRVAKSCHLHTEVSELLQAKVIERDVQGTIAKSPLGLHATLKRCRDPSADTEGSAVVPAVEDRNRELGADRPLVAHVKHLQRYFDVDANSTADGGRRVSCIVDGAAFCFDIRPDAAHDGVEVANARCTDTLVAADALGVVMPGFGSDDEGAHTKWVQVPSHSSSELLPLVAPEPLLGVPGVVCRVHVVRRHDGTLAALAGRPCLVRGTMTSDGSAATTALSIAASPASRTVDAIKIMADATAPRLQGPHDDVTRLRTAAVGCFVKYVPGRTLTLLGDDGTAVHVDETEAKNCIAAAKLLTEADRNPARGVSRLQAQWLSSPFTFNESIRPMNGAWMVCGTRLRPHRLRAANPFLVATNVAVKCDNASAATGSWQPNADSAVTVVVDMNLLAAEGKGWEEPRLQANATVMADIVRHPVTGKLVALARRAE